MPPSAVSIPAAPRKCPQDPFITVPSAPPLEHIASFTVQAWIFPTTPLAGEQGIVAHWDAATSRGFALVITAEGVLALRTGDGTSSEVPACRGTRAPALVSGIRFIR